MTIGFILNGEDVVIQARADQRLQDILRDHFKLTSVKCGCRLGRCGSCSVIMDGKVVPSCMVPAFNVRGSEIITLEGFSTTNEYQDIEEGFRSAGWTGCGYCHTATILACEALFERKSKPTTEEIVAAFDGVLCRCLNERILVQAVTAAIEVRRSRTYGRHH